MATEPAAGASAPKPATESKGINWLLPLFILAMFFVVAIGAEALYDQRRSITWLLDMLFRYGIPFAAAGLAALFIKKKIDGGH